MEGQWGREIARQCLAYKIRIMQGMEVEDKMLVVAMFDDGYGPSG
jgi:hypothetical protein